MGSSALILALSLLKPAGAAPPPWPPADGLPMTLWGKQVAAGITALPEYPRPQLVRKPWLNLNGLWDYAILGKADAAPTAYVGKILVPFPVESVLSKVNKRVDENSRVWYHRSFQVPAAWRTKRVLLHFGAVDWETTVRVNGKTYPVHRGGYDEFSFDITDALKRNGPQALVVSVWDPTEGGQPAGKQSRNPEGIFYTPSTGIWQTVWLEPVPTAHIENLKLVPDVDRSQLLMTVNADSARSMGQSKLTVDAVVMEGGKEVAHGVGRSGAPIAIPIPHARLWWPDQPSLYDLKVTLKQGAQIVDSVGSYFGMRKISVGSDAQGVTRILLNNTFVLHNGLLDQGFWPDGLYTAPTDEALRYDIEMTRKLGFNMSRKHIKVEPERWYYWADKLGLLVWQDMPAAMALTSPKQGVTIPDMPGQFERELRRMIVGRFNHPCIVLWVLFNEGMGLDMSPTKHEIPSDDSQMLMKRMVTAARQEDPTRLIDHESGAGGGDWQGKNPWDIGLGDIIDYHCYGPPKAPLPEAHRASVIGEYGFAVAPLGSVLNELPQVTSPGASGLLLTQLTDVENEHNGALTYNRALKGSETAEQIGAAMREHMHPWSGPGALTQPEAKKPLPRSKKEKRIR